MLNSAMRRGHLIDGGIGTINTGNFRNSLNNSVLDCQLENVFFHNSDDKMYPLFYYSLFILL